MESLFFLLPETKKQTKNGHGMERICKNKLSCQKERTQNPLFMEDVLLH